MLKLKFYPDMTVGGVGSTQGTSGVANGPGDPKMDPKDIQVFKDMGGTNPTGRNQIAANGLSIKREGKAAYLVFRDDHGQSQCVKLEPDSHGLQAKILQPDGSYKKVDLNGGNAIEGFKNFNFDEFLDNMTKTQNPTKELAAKIGLNPDEFSTQDHISIQDGKTTKIITERRDDLTNADAKTVYVANDKDGDGKINHGEKVRLYEYDSNGNRHIGGNLNNNAEYTLDSQLEIDVQEMRSQGDAKTFKQWWDQFTAGFSHGNSGSSAAE